jgi:NAD(P)-dependent dehydrogenase (short-subunit alcohol dehydrogenase family)
MKIDNKVAIITGAASGMGRAIARVFFEEGALLVLADRNEQALKELQLELDKSLAKAVICVCDVASEKDIENLIRIAMERFSRIDILLNNAGIMDDFFPVDRIQIKHWERVMAVNLNGPFYAMRLAIPIMLKQEKGVILNIASVGGLYGTRAGAAYTASKHALIGLTKNTGFMYANKGIRCNAIAPGGVNTHIGDNLIPDALGYERCVAGASLIPRMGEPDEIAKLALFLCSDDASLINGSVVVADAGWTAY